MGTGLRLRRNLNHGRTHGDVVEEFPRLKRRAEELEENEGRRGQECSINRVPRATIP